MIVSINPDRKDWNELVSRPILEQADLQTIVNGVFDDVLKVGDAAVKAYTKKFDKASVESLQATEEEILAAAEKVSPELQEAIKLAASKHRKIPRGTTTF